MNLPLGGTSLWPIAPRPALTQRPQDMELTDNFWQYAIIEERGLKAPHLHFIKHHVVSCAKVKRGDRIEEAETRGPSAGFPAPLKAQLGIH